ncbi:lipopolysaccharide biosynthesis protein [Silvibacterium acidisoli]|uniref:lipopolysaccharide biosynthesis protein n=1 Tax=Acidobacteriaceae bacterium ZG23-2 TaxID=2883246 RepID=UPI00406CBCE0
MRKHLSNAAYGALDYAAHPLVMLLVAPIILNRLGVAEYGIWTIATAVISVGGIVASGFSDANIQRIASLRSANETQTMKLTTGSIFAINLTAGIFLAACAWIGAPYAVPRIVVAQPALAHECLAALRIAAVIVLVRSIESVAVSTQRGFEAYRESVRISTAVRILTLVAAAVLALCGQRCVSILVATGVFLVAGTALQFLQLPRFLREASVLPIFHREEGQRLLRMGIFSWIQALGSVVLGQLDRLLLGVSLGAVAVAPYALCVQFAQPLSGFTASTLQFLFPYLSGRFGQAGTVDIRRIVFKAFLCNFMIVAVEAVAILAVGPHLVRAWAGPVVARAAAPIFPVIIVGAAIMGLSVTANYALLAFGMFRAVTAISLSSRVATLLLMVYLLHHGGLKEMAISRLSYGVLTLLLYVPLMQKLEVANPVSMIRSRLFARSDFAEERRP